MKTTILSLLLFLGFESYGQVADVMWVPSQKSLVASQRPYHSPLGVYVGGYYTTNFPSPYIYTTPLSIFNRVGINYVGPKQKWGFMGGVYFENKKELKEYKPDFWLKIYPLRIITGANTGLDLTLGVNYMEGFRYGVGLSLPTSGIY